MNKKVLSAILFSALFAGTGTFTSCIDNDEPAGIEELRGAKAELIRAKVTVEQANAALVLAQAEVEKAKAAKELAEASIKEAIAAKKEAEAEAEAARTEEEKARVEAQIAKYQQQIEEDALKHQETMVNLQNNLATAKRAYELLLAHVEIAKAVCADKDAMTLAELEYIVYVAQTKVDELAKEVESAQKHYYEVSVGYKYHNDNLVALVEKSVAEAEKDLADAEANLAYWQNYKSEDAQAVEWMAEVKVLEDSIAGLQDVLAKKEIALELLKQSEEAQKLNEAILKAEEAKAALEAPVTTEELAYTYLYWNDEENKKVVAAEKETDAKTAAINIAGADFEEATEYGAGIAALKKEIASYTTEKKYWLQEIADADEKTLADYAEAAAKDVDAWEKAKKAYDDATKSTEISYASIFAYNEKTGVYSGAYPAFKKAMTEANALTDDNAKTKAVLKAEQAFADALVTFYNGLPAGQAGLSNVSLEVTVGDSKVLQTKTVKEWLSDATNKDVWLNQIYAYFGSWEKFWKFTEGDKNEVLNTDGKSIKTKASSALTSWVTKTSLVASTLKTLQDASTKAFGKAENYSDVLAKDGDNSYLHNKPEVADIKYVYSNGITEVGSYGKNVLATDYTINFVANNYEAIIADYKAAIEYWTAAVEDIKEALVAYQGELDAADAAIEAAKEARDEYAAQWEEEDAEVEDLEIRIMRLENMKDILAKAVATYLPEKYNEEMYDFDRFAEFLAGQVGEAEANVIAKKEALATAQVNAELALDGKYDFIADAKDSLDKKLAELEAAQAELDEATANLKKGLEIIAAVNGAE